MKTKFVNFYRGRTSSNVPLQTYDPFSGKPNTKLSKPEAEAKAREKQQMREKVLLLSQTHLNLMQEGQKLLTEYDTLKATAQANYAKANEAKSFKDYEAMSSAWTKPHITIIGQYDKAYKDAMRSLSIYRILLRRYQSKLQNFRIDLRNGPDTGQNRAMTNDARSYYYVVKKAQNWLSANVKRRTQRG